MAVIEEWAGHFSGGSSDKVWAGAFTSDGHFLSTWGRRGSGLSVGDKPCGSQAAAASAFAKKVREKQSEGYVAVPFDHPDYGIRSFGPGGGATATSLGVPSVVGGVREIRYQTAHVMPLSPRELAEAVASLGYGVSEKVNGERCLVVVDAAGKVEAFNRLGQLVSTVPEGARGLARLGVACVIDGERLTGQGAGTYVAFDLLEWQGQDARHWPYSQRIRVLEAAMVGAGLVPAGSPTMEGDAKLQLLVSEADPVKGRAVVQRIEEKRGEGVIVRTHSAGYQAGDTQDIRKHKYLSDLDAFVIAVHKGSATGSVSLGLVRPGDGAVIEVCRVRSGLVDADIRRIGGMLERGEPVVLRVEYLPIRTVGIRLVEPRTSMRELRGDKLPGDCTTDQLGPEKAALVAAAAPVARVAVGREHGL